MKIDCYLVCKAVQDYDSYLIRYDYYDYNTPRSVFWVTWIQCDTIQYDYDYNTIWQSYLIIFNRNNTSQLTVPMTGQNGQSASLYVRTGCDTITLSLLHPYCHCRSRRTSCDPIWNIGTKIFSRCAEKILFHSSLPAPCPTLHPLKNRNWGVL